MFSRVSAAVWILFLVVGFNGSSLAETEAEAPDAQARPATPGGFVAGMDPAQMDQFLQDSALAETVESVIHPDLQTSLASSDLVKVFLLLRSESTPGAQDPWAIKQQHLPAIRGLSKKIHDLGQVYRPQGTRAEQHDADAVMALRGTMTRDHRRQLRNLHEESDSRLDDMRRAVALANVSRAARSQNVIIGQVLRYGGKVLSAMGTGNILSVELPGNAISELAAHPLVGQIVPVHEGSPSLNVSQATIKAWAWYNSGLTGGAYDAGVADSGVQQDHPAFAGINFFNNTGSPTDPASNGHGTHVAGIIASGNATYQGIAYGLDALIWGPAGGSAFGTMDWAVTSAGQAPEVFNMSWGYGIADDEDYNYEDRWFDVYIDYYDVPVVFAAGNSGWNDTLPRLRHPSAGYNSITVANMNDGGTVDRSADVRSSDSSVGPTLSGRRKPDISAPGSNILSTNSGWTGNGLAAGGCGPANPNDFCNAGGTSMAAPHVAGAVVLMTEGGIFDAMAQKAILLNTASWWTSNDTLTTADDGPVTIPSSSATMWDKSYGWGYIDLNHARIHEADYFIDTVVPRNGTATEDDYKLYKGVHAAGDSATLVWHRRGTRGADWPTDKFDSSVFALSDLNLRLFSESSGVQLDSDLAIVDNVHQVHTSTPFNVVIKVDAWSTSFAGAGSEQFALATESGFQQVDFPDQFAGIAIWPSEVEPNEVFDVEFWIRNDSDIASFANQLDMTLSGGFFLVIGSDIQTDSEIQPGATSTHGVWSLRAPSSAVGASTITVRHSHTSYQESYGPFSWNMGITVQYDTMPPSPNPLTWQAPPDDSSTTALTMTTTAAIDVHGSRYFFNYLGSATGGGGAGNTWRANATYTDVGLGINHSYCYRARAEDYAGTPNSTGYTPTECAYTGIEPSTGPDFTSIGTTVMNVSSLNVPSGLTRGLSGLNIYNDTTSAESGWHQNNNAIVFSSLTPNTAYGFWTQSRNGDGDVSAGSDGIVRYTLATLPTPLSVAPFADDTTQAASVDPADANPAGTEYLFENATLGTDSGWTTATQWLNTGLACGSAYTYHARARNAEGVETAAKLLGSATAGFDTDLDGLLNCVDPDDDNDGKPDPFDCNPLDGTVWLAPSQIVDLTLTHSGGVGGATSMSWQAPNSPGTTGLVVYDMISSLDAESWNDAVASCEESDEADLMATHLVDPSAGAVIFFLGRGDNACGNGNAGFENQAGAAVARTGVRDCGCVHDTCVEGVALDASCDPCVAAICAVDSYCCDTAWDSVCVGEVASVCGATCP